MERKAFRNGMIFAIIGSILTLIGDILISSGVQMASTGSQIVDSMVQASANSDIRDVLGGLFGALGIPLEGIGYYQLSKMFKKQKGFWTTFYRWATLIYVGFAGCGVHVACAAAPLLYKWIAPTSVELAISVAEKYIYYFLFPPMIIFGVTLFVALIYQTVAVAKKETPYKRSAVFYNMALGVILPYVLAWIIGNNAVGNAIGTGAISIGHLYMFTMFLLTMPKDMNNWQIATN